MVATFAKQNDDPTNSPNFRSEERDDLSPLKSLIADARLLVHGDLALLLLRCLKILSRKLPNRQQFDPMTIRSVVMFLQNPPSIKVAAEAANVLLNVCYEKENVDVVIAQGAVPLLIMAITSSDQDLQANAAGALQSICFQEVGKRLILQHQGIGALVHLLCSQNAKVQTRAVGAMHNLSSEAESIRPICEAGAVPALVALLGPWARGLCLSGFGPTSRNFEVSRCGDDDGVGGLAFQESRGALFDVVSYVYDGLMDLVSPQESRGALFDVVSYVYDGLMDLLSFQESRAREAIVQAEAVPPLTRLLFGADVQSAACSTGALLNVRPPYE
ncbi:hypothetical protein PAPYR_11634 [Paratrimastix pyriformis]|uniref:Uncharacterized protein n=1 Tax=Paratrimastix pyriformis TaxID=342808 RepID=A0ABQ8U739_9EUKA|nr:hypothetical protein PAPYR_11634 [Paratrimastix pyriformis]